MNVDLQSAGQSASRVLAAVTSYAFALKYASEQLKADREIVLAAVSNYGYALDYAPAELQNDREVVLAAVKQDVSALDCASDELQNDREVVLAAVKQDRFALTYASGQLQQDPALISWSRLTRGKALWRIVREHHTANSVGTYWYKQVMRADFDADGSAVMIGRGAKRAREEYDDDEFC